MQGKESYSWRGFREGRTLVAKFIPCSLRPETRGKKLELRIRLGAAKYSKREHASSQVSVAEKLTAVHAELGLVATLMKNAHLGGINFAHQL